MNENFNALVLTARTPGIRIRKDGRVTITAEGARLLGLDDGSLINFRKEENKIFIGKVSVPGIRVSGKTPKKQFYSTYMARELAENLQGYGTYRIEEENQRTFYPGDKYYSIFFRRYNK